MAWLVILSEDVVLTLLANARNLKLFLGESITEIIGVNQISAQRAEAVLYGFYLFVETKSVHDVFVHLGYVLNRIAVALLLIVAHAPAIGYQVHPLDGEPLGIAAKIAKLLLHLLSCHCHTPYYRQLVEGKHRSNRDDDRADSSNQNGSDHSCMLSK